MRMNFDGMYDTEKAIYLTGAILHSWSSIYESVWQGIRRTQQIQRHRYNLVLFDRMLQSVDQGRIFAPDPIEESNFHFRVSNIVDLKLKYLGILIATLKVDELNKRYVKIKSRAFTLYKIRNDFAHSIHSFSTQDEPGVSLVSHETQNRAWERKFSDPPLIRPKNMSLKQRIIRMREYRGETFYSFVEIEKAVADMIKLKIDIVALVNDLPDEGEMIAPLPPPKKKDKPTEGNAAE